MCPVPAHPPFDHPIRLVPGFDPAALPELNPPVEGVQPWQWLADSATSETAKSEYLASHVKGFGTVDGSDKDLTVEPRSNDEIIGGFLDQQVHLLLPGRGMRMTVTAVPEGDAAQAAGRASRDQPSGDVGAGPQPTLPRGSFPLTDAVAIVGTTAPRGTGDWAVGRDLSAELSDFFAGRGVETWDAVAVDKQRDWVERVLLVAFSNPGLVIVGAAAHGQPYLAVWRPDARLGAGSIEVVDVSAGPTPSVVARGSAVARRVSATTCPLIPGSGCGDLCRLHGGPWISRSIRAAARWEARRARMIRALGCDTCGDGAIKVFQKQVFGSQRTTIPIRPDMATPTRFERLVDAPRVP